MKFELPDYPLLLIEQIPIPGMGRIIDEYLCDEQYIVSKLVIAANNGDLECIEKYLDISEIKEAVYLPDLQPEMIRRIDYHKTANFILVLFDIVNWNLSSVKGKEKKERYRSINKWIVDNARSNKLFNLGHMCFNGNGIDVGITFIEPMENLSPIERRDIFYRFSCIPHDKKNEEKKIKDIEISIGTLASLYWKFKKDIKEDKTLYHLIRGVLLPPLKQGDLDFCLYKLLSLINRKSYDKIETSRAIFSRVSRSLLASYFGDSLKKCQKHNEYLKNYNSQDVNNCSYCDIEERFNKGKLCKKKRSNGTYCANPVREGKQCCGPCNPTRH